MDAVARIEPFDEGYPDKPIFTDAVDRVQNSAFWTNNFADYLISRGWDYMIDASLDILKDQIID
jgi:hypothetical protein